VQNLAISLAWEVGAFDSRIWASFAGSIGEMTCVAAQQEVADEASGLKGKSANSQVWIVEPAPARSTQTARSGAGPIPSVHSRWRVRWSSWKKPKENLGEVC